MQLLNIVRMQSNFPQFKHLLLKYNDKREMLLRKYNIDLS